MNTIVFDIETGPLASVLAKPEDWFEPDGRVSDPAKVRASLMEKAEGAALSPITGQILAIGYHDDNGVRTRIFEDEKVIIEEFFDVARDQINAGGRLCGWNILDFDLPFLVFRGLVNRVPVPVALGKYYRGRFQFVESFMDLMLVAQAGKYQAKGYSLDRVARAFGLPGKNGDGANFHKLDMAQAREYLENDIRITSELARRFGL